MFSPLDYFVPSFTVAPDLAPSRPDRSAVVTALLAAERLAKGRGGPGVDLAKLQGNWQLRFVSGTSRRGRRITLGPGRFLPDWVTIGIGFEYGDGPTVGQGRIHNRVQLGALRLELSGPCQAYGDRRILAFDFTALLVAVGPVTLYDGRFRDPEAFGRSTLKSQAFFSFFVVDGDRIAARGRGGGLALWTALKSEPTA